VSALQPSLDEATVALIQAALSLTSSLRVPDALRRLVESACSITGASWGTIAVLNHADMDVDPAGMLSPDPSDASSGTGLCSGVPTATLDELAQMAGAPDPAGAAHGSSESLLSGLEGTGMVIDNDLGRTSAFTGTIEGEETGSLLSAPLRLHGQVYGHLYLCDKPGGFTRSDADAVLTLAQAAAAAVDNARPYREARVRQPADLGAWKVEHDGQPFDDAVFLRAKQYCERFGDHDDVHIAGLPAEIAAQVRLEDLLTPCTWDGKLVPKRVPGGVVLSNTTFTLR